MKKDDLPYMPFYVGDWLKAPDIQCLPYELKGIWFEMLCYMWESKERGVLNYSKEELSRLLRMDLVLLEQKLNELLKFGIYSVRANDGAIFNRRMIKDQNIREKRQKAGKIGGKASFASRFAQSKSQANVDIDIDNENESINEKAFNLIWEQYPSKTGRKEALRHFKSSVNNESELNDLKTALNNYKNSERVKNGFIQNGSKWFNNWKDWVNFKEIPKNKEFKEEPLQRGTAYREWKEPDWMK